MPVPHNIDAILYNARREILQSQLVAALVGSLLGPGCLIFSVLPLNALPEYLTTLRVAGVIVTLLLMGLFFETRRRLRRFARIDQVIRDDPKQIEQAYMMRDRTTSSSSAKVHIELQDGTTENLPLIQHEARVLLTYLKARVPHAVRQSAASEPEFES